MVATSTVSAAAVENVYMYDPSFDNDDLTCNTALPRYAVLPAELDSLNH